MTDNLPVLRDPNEIVVEAVEMGAVVGSTPKQLIGNAVAAANELAAIITSRQLFSNIQGKRYVRCEGWTTLAAIMGCLPREVEVTEKDGTYVAVVELHRIKDDALMGRASAECGMAEPTWKSRAPYARRSMAVTRATSKACRIAFSWVMTLAGFEVTPAEEMMDVHRGDGARPETPSSQAPQGEVGSPSPSPKKGGIDQNKKARLSQKNISHLIEKAEGDEQLAIIAASAVLGKSLPSSKAEDWPEMNANEHAMIVSYIEARLAEVGKDLPAGIQVGDLSEQLEKLLADTSKDAKLRIRILAAFEKARDSEKLTVDGLKDWIQQLS